MMLGHALLVFALVAGVTGRKASPERALALGAVAGVFAAVPDVDVLFALPGLVDGVVRLVGAGVAGPGDLFTVTGSFWAASTEVHRSVTHSVVVAAPVSLAAGMVSGRGERTPVRRLAAVVLFVGPVVAALAATGVGAAAMTATFAVAVWVAAVAARWRVDVSVRTATGLAAVGLFTHPFGDLFTGQPPQLLYPLGVDPLSTRITVAADPTLQLLAVFGLEVVAAWAALWVGLGLLGRTPLSHVRPVALAGLGYALAGPLIVPPTLATSYHFVFTVLGVGLLAAVVTLRGNGPGDAVSGGSDGPTATEPEAQPDGGTAGREGVTATVPSRAVTSLTTGTAAVTLAWAAYAVVYLAGAGPG